MSKHNKPNDDPTTGSGGRPTPAAGTLVASAPKAAPAARKGTRSPVPKKDLPWTDVASFVINFERRTLPAGATERRITAHKMQEGGTTAEWTGLAQQPLAQWIADHVGDWDEAEPAQALPAPAVTADLATAMPMLSDTSAFAVAITTIGAEQAGAMERPMRTGRVDEAEDIVLRRDAAFDLNAVVQFTGANGDRIAAPSVPCTLQFFTRNTVTQERLRLGEVRAVPMAGSGPSLAGTLTQIALPPGTYRVTSVALLKGIPPKLAYAQGPLLEVV